MTLIEPRKTRRERSPRLDAKRNSAKVIKAAEELFATNGPDLHMSEVARKAGVGIATVYRSYPSKDALLGALATKRFSDCLDSTEGIWSSGGEQAGFDALIMNLATLFSADAALRDLLWSLPPSYRPISDPKLMARCDELRRRAVDAGVLRKEMALHDFQAIICALGTAISVGMAPNMAAEIICYGLYPRSTSSPSIKS